jgi:hypothetical protein
VAAVPSELSLTTLRIIIKNNNLKIKRSQWRMFCCLCYWCRSCRKAKISCPSDGSTCYFFREHCFLPRVSRCVTWSQKCHAYVRNSFVHNATRHDKARASLWMLDITSFELSKFHNVLWLTMATYRRELFLIPCQESTWSTENTTRALNNIPLEIWFSPWAFILGQVSISTRTWVTEVKYLRLLCSGLLSIL